MLKITLCTYNYKVICFSYVYGLHSKNSADKSSLFSHAFWRLFCCFEAHLIFLQFAMQWFPENAKASSLPNQEMPFSLFGLYKKQGNRKEDKKGAEIKIYLIYQLIN